ncbi:unnamed protein product [Sphagnum jensenii]|jgi:hypothetical protein|uniref:Uncharacterized protein n=1 Tax=Sphagnum jensenii TaxID=128206 RepID=A0ABP0VL54_9BRYO
MASGFGKRAGLPGWAGVRVAAADAFVAAARLAPPLGVAGRSLLRFGDRFAFSRGDPEQKRRSHMMSFHKSLPLSFSSAHSFCP